MQHSSYNAHPSNAQKGFTLVELAMVLMVVALIVAGAFAGQKLLSSSKSDSLVNEIEEVQQSVKQFYDTYGAIPGDMWDADSRLGSYAGGAITTLNGDGNGILETNNSNGDNELLVFWQHLSLAGLIEGQYDGATPTPGVGYKRVSIDQNAAMFVNLNGGQLMLSIGKMSGGNMLGIISPSEAMRLEQKLKDDGTPGAGRIRATDDGVAGSPGDCIATGVYDVATTADTATPCIIEFEAASLQQVGADISLSTLSDDTGVAPSTDCKTPTGTIALGATATLPCNDTGGNTYDVECKIGGIETIAYNCQLDDCTAQSFTDIRGNTVDFAATAVGNTASFDCTTLGGGEIGYRANGTVDASYPRLTCYPPGGAAGWNVVPGGQTIDGYCDVPADCAQADLTGNGTYNATIMTVTGADPTPVGSSVSIACNSGYTGTPASETINCTAGTYDTVSITCAPDNCTVSAITGYDAVRMDPVGTTTTTSGNGESITCKTGYSGTGSTPSCSAGSWTGSAPTCNADCGVTPDYSASDATVAAGDSAHGDTRTISCDSGFTQVEAGTIESTCSDGSWSSPTITCTADGCLLSALSGYSSASMNPSDGTTVVADGGSQTVSCQSGYTGSSTTPSCSAGSWTGSAPTCTIVSCAANPVTALGWSNVVADAGGNTYNTTRTVRCDASAWYFGAPIDVTCNASGTWTGSAPTCVNVNCTGSACTTSGNPAECTGTVAACAAKTCAAEPGFAPVVSATATTGRIQSGGSGSGYGSAREFICDGCFGYQTTGSYGTTGTPGRMVCDDSGAFKGQNDVCVASPFAFETEYLVNDGETTGDQTAAGGTVLQNGKYVVIYSGEHSSDSSATVAQIFNANGTLSGSEFLVHAVSGNNQYYGDSATLTNGNFVVIWTDVGRDGDNQGQFGQIFQENGTAVGSDFQVNTATTEKQQNGIVVALTDGKFIVVYGDYSKGDGACGGCADEGVLGQLFNADGTKFGSEFALPADVSGAEYMPAVTPLDGGAFAVAWHGNTAGNHDTYLRLYNAAGTATSSDIILANGAGGQRMPNLTTLGNGKIAASWISGDADGDGVYTRVINSDGTSPTAIVAANTTTTDAQGTYDGWRRSHTIKAYGEDKYLLSWTSENQDASGGSAIIGRIFSDSGTALSAEIQMSEPLTDDQYLNGAFDSILYLGDGNFAMHWSSKNQDTATTQGAYGRQFSLVNPIGGGGTLAYNWDGTKWTAALTCTAGHTAISSTAAECTPTTTATWNNTDLRCKEDCSAPPQASVTDGSVNAVAWNNTIGAWEYNVTCDSGYASSASSSTCLPGGSWSSTITCDLAVCSDLPAPSNGAVSGSGGAIGNTRSFTCDSGYSITGSSTRTCQADGSWSGYTTSCAPEQCETSLTGGAAIQINTYEVDSQEDVSMTELQNGNFVALITSGGSTPHPTDGSWQGIDQRIYEADGTPVDANETLVNTHTSGYQFRPSVTTLTDGKYAVAWVSTNGDGDDYATYMRIMNEDGTAFMPSDTIVNTYTTGRQEAIMVEALSNDTFIAAWSGPISASEVSGVAGRIFNNDGTEAVAQFQINDTTSSTQRYPTLLELANGNVLVAYGSTSGGTNIVAKIISNTGVDVVSEFMINQTTAGQQRWVDHFRGTKRAALLQNGNFVVAWVSNHDGDFDTYARIFDQDGNPVTDEFMVTETTAGNEERIAMDTLPDGRFAITWSRNDDVYARVFNSNGTASGSEFLVSGGVGVQRDPSLLALSNGNFVIGYEAENVDADDFAAMMSIYDSSYTIVSATLSTPTFNSGSGEWESTITCNTGSTLFGSSVLSCDPATDTWGGGGTCYASCGAPEATNLSASSRINSNTAGDQAKASVVAMSNGNYMVLWGDENQDNQSIQVETSNGTDVGTEVDIDSTSDYFGAIAELSNGNLVVTYYDWAPRFSDANNSLVVAKVISNTGTEVVAPYQVNVSTADEQHYPDVAALHNGNYVITWKDDSGSDGAQDSVPFRIYQPDGTPVTGEVMANTTTSGNQRYPQIATLQNGNFVIAWEGNVPGDSDGIAFRIFDPAGAEVVAEQRINTDLSGAANMPTIDALDNGDFVVVWHASDADGHGVFARVYQSDGTAVSSAFQVNTYTTGDQGSVDGWRRGANVAGLENGMFVAIWTSGGQDLDGLGVYGQLVRNDGSLIGEEFKVSENSGGDQEIRFASNPIAKLDHEKFVVVYTDGLGAGNDVERIIFTMNTAYDGAIIQSGDSDHTDTRTVVCGNGYSGTSGTLTCTSGAWAETVAPVCTPGSCSALGNPTNGSVSTASGTDHGDVATYSCDSGYVMTGDLTRVCQLDNNWSGSAPTCTVDPNSSCPISGRSSPTADDETIISVSNAIKRYWTSGNDYVGCFIEAVDYKRCDVTGEIGSTDVALVGDTTNWVKRRSVVGSSYVGCIVKVVTP